MSGRQKPNPITLSGSRHQPQNLAVQRSLMEIFDEFTEVISGELKTMNFEDADQVSRFKG